MKMKLLDYTIMSLMAGSSMGIWAAEGSTPATAAPENAACAQAECNADGALLFRLRSQSYDEPVTSGTSAQSFSRAAICCSRLSWVFSALVIVISLKGSETGLPWCAALESTVGNARPPNKHFYLI